MKKDSDTIQKRGRGRPSLGTTTESIMLRLPGDMLAAIDAAAGQGKRAEFIRAALDRALRAHRRRTGT